MADTRLYTLEDKVAVLQEDLEAAQRRWEQMLRAKHEQRIQESDYEQALARQRDRVRGLERELAEARAEVEDAA